MKKVYSIFIFTIIIAFTWSALAGEPHFYGSAHYAQSVIVAKSGGSYTTIQGAIDSVSDAGASNRYAVIVYPGIYTENITMKDYVDIVGFGRTNSIILVTSGTAIIYPANKGTVVDIGVLANYGTLGVNSTAITSGGADSAMVRCDLIVTKSGGDFLMKSVSVTGGSFRMIDCYHTYSITGATTDTGLIQSAFYQTGALTLFLLHNNELTMTCDDTNDDIVGFETITGGIGSFLLQDNIMDISAVDTACALWLYGTATGATFSNNRFTVSGTTNTSWGFYVDSTAGGAVVNSINNEMIVTSGGNAYSCEIFTGDIWNSYFDKITAAQATTGAGTKNIVSSNSAGSLLISGDAILGYRIAPVTLVDDTASGDIITVTFGESVVFGEVCYPDVTDNEWKKALATNAAVTHPGMGIALETKANGESGKLLLRGTIRDDSAFAGVMGDIVFLSDAAAGDVLYVAPSDSGDIVQILGFVIADNYFYFNPDYTYVEVP